MDLELLGSLGWREGLIAVIGLLVLYIIVLYLRVRRLQHGVAALPPPLAAQSAVASYSAIQEPELAQAAAAALSALDPVAPAPASGPPAATAVPDARACSDASPPAFAWNEPPPEIPGQALIDALQRELYQLRCEVDELRAEVLAVRDDFRQQAVQSTAPLRGASPLYNNAMQMAIEGHDASTIAQHCGIARAEADLVVALARNRREGF